MIAAVCASLGGRPARGWRLVTAGLGVGRGRKAPLVAGGRRADRARDRPSRRSPSGRALRHRLWLSVVWLIVLVLAAVFADLLPLGDHNDTSTTIGVQGYARPDLFSAHPLGTNNFALDLLARCIYGARVSLLTSRSPSRSAWRSAAPSACSPATSAAPIDTVVGVFADPLLAFPPLVLLIALAAMLGPPTPSPRPSLKTGVGAGDRRHPDDDPPRPGQHARGRSARVRAAAAALGARDRRIIVRELLPNVLLPLVSYAFVVSRRADRRRGLVVVPRARAAAARAVLGEHDRRGRPPRSAQPSARRARCRAPSCSRRCMH